MIKNSGKIHHIILLIFISIFLISCTNDSKPFEKDTYMMGTIIQLKIYGDNAKKATEAVLQRINDIENKMSVNIDTSEISKLNAKAGISSEKLSKDTFSVLEKSVYYSKLTQGSLDATIEPIVKLWGIGTEKERIPALNEINEKLKLLDYNDIILDSKSSTAQLRRTGQAIDLGAIAKGYTADEIKKVLISNKINSALINLGGNVYAVGSKTDGSSWTIGVQNPLEKRGKYIGTINVTDKSIVTSGNYERYFIKDGKRYHHIFDPKSGYPSESGLISTTIISDYSIDGDALSTSTYIMGLTKGIKLIESIKGIEAIFITEDKKIYLTSGIKDKFNLTSKEFTYEKGR